MFKDKREKFGIRKLRDGLTDSVKVGSVVAVTGLAIISGGVQS